MRKYIFLVFVLISCDLFREPSLEEKVKSKLGTNDWDELVDMGLELNKEMNLPVLPKKKNIPNNISLSKNLKIDYQSPEIYVDNFGAHRSLPYMGHLMQANLLVKLEDPYKDGGDRGIGEVQRLGEYWFFEVNSGSTFEWILYSEDGRILQRTLSDRAKIAFFGDYFLVKREESFELYQASNDQFEIKLTFSADQLLDQMKELAYKGKVAGNIGFTDFHFEVEQDIVTIWFLSINSTGFMSGQAHAIAKANLKNKTLELDKTFGLSTFADNMPLPTPFFYSLKHQSQFWVPRANDQQIDTYNEEGELLFTSELLPPPGDIVSEANFGSDLILDWLEQDLSASDFYMRYQSLPFIAGVYKVDDFLLVFQRNNSNMEAYQLFTFLDLNGQPKSEHLLALDILPLGTYRDQLLTIYSASETAEKFPPWLQLHPDFDADAFRQHRWHWLCAISFRDGFIEDEG